MNTDTRIEIVVQSKFPELLQKFKQTFIPTTAHFHNLTLHEVTGQEYGAKVINRILIPTLRQGCEVFGVFNDDLVFSEGWVESVLPYFGEYVCVSPGYIESDKDGSLEKAVEATRNTTGAVDLFYGPISLYRADIFKQIGIFDERFDWSVDDLDWAWRISLNGMKSGTLKRITVQHLFQKTLTNTKEWNAISDVNKQRFYDKHGYRAYRQIRERYKASHQYFRQFSCGST